MDPLIRKNNNILLKLFLHMFSFKTRLHRFAVLIFLGVPISFFLSEDRKSLTFFSSFFESFRILRK